MEEKTIVHIQYGQYRIWTIQERGELILTSKAHD